MLSPLPQGEKGGALARPFHAVNLCWFVALRFCLFLDEGVNEHAFDECLHELKKKAKALGATTLRGLQLVQSQFQRNQRTGLLATAVKGRGASQPRSASFRA
jgi:hypothetical protein